MHLLSGGHEHVHVLYVAFLFTNGEELEKDSYPPSKACSQDGYQPSVLHYQRLKSCITLIALGHVARCTLSSLLFPLGFSRASLAGGGTDKEEVAFASVAGKSGGAFELDAGFGVAA
jgi:hypothetical protein